MRHHLKIVARNFQVDQKELEEFALENPKKYGIDNENGFITTSTWWTEDLIRDFRETKKQNKLIWFEVYRSDEEEGTETIASFDEEQQAKDYIKANPEMNLDYDKWQYNTKTKENEKL